MLNLVRLSPHRPNLRVSASLLFVGVCRRANAFTEQVNATSKSIIDASIHLNMHDSIRTHSTAHLDICFCPTKFVPVSARTLTFYPL